jgi:hypothetical protein
LRVLPEDLQLEEAFGGLAVGPTKRAKGTKIVAINDDHSIPLAVVSKVIHRRIALLSVAPNDCRVPVQRADHSRSN